jgi:hypothetical protein
MLSLLGFLLFPLLALGVRRRRGVRALVIAMFIGAIVVDSDAQFHFLTALGTAGYDSQTIWTEAAATTLAYVWFPDSAGQRVLQFLATMMMCLFIAWVVGGVWA